VFLPDVFTLAHRTPIILAAARNNVPAVYADPRTAACSPTQSTR
jgi:hypothetical protein